MRREGWKKEIRDMIPKEGGRSGQLPASQALPRGALGRTSSLDILTLLIWKGCPL